MEVKLSTYNNSKRTVFYTHRFFPVRVISKKSKATFYAKEFFLNLN